jgi:hypothetical protein
MKRIVFSTVGALALAVGTAPLSVAAPNPNPTGHGQPGVECGDPGAESEPHGFTTPGFDNADDHYAGEGTNVDHTTNPHAESQYDVACFQFTSSGH